MASALHLLVRSVHVAGMALLLGGAVFTWTALRTRSRPPLSLLVQFEWVFWGTLGVMLATGVGNLGALGAPGPGTRWGATLTVKLLVVLALVLVSFPRTLAVLRLGDRRGDPPSGVGLRRTYALTVGLLLLAVMLAEVLAHG